MSAPYGKRSVLLRGNPIVSEDGVAGATIKPGYLLKGVTTVNPQSLSNTTPIPAAFALERSELGTGIDSTYTGVNNGTGSPDYAVGDQVKVANCAPGTRLTAWIDSGVVTAEDSLLQSAGDGTLAVRTGTNYVVARALEAVTAIALTKVKVEVL